MKQKKIISHEIPKDDSRVFINTKLLTGAHKSNPAEKHDAFDKNKSSADIVYSSKIALVPVKIPLPLSEYPYFERFRKIVLKPDNDIPLMKLQSLRDSLKILEGCWRINMIANKTTLKKFPSRPELDFLINITTEGCPIGNCFVRGRLYNMTISEILLDSAQNGVVQKRAMTFYSDFRPLKEFAVLDYTLHSLIRNLCLVNYDSRTDVLYLSDGDTTVEAYRHNSDTTNLNATTSSTTRALINIATSCFN